MSPILQNTIFLGRTLVVMMTLVAMLFVSSAQGFSEECSEETVSQEVELVISRREEQGLERRSRFDFHGDVCHRRNLSKLIPAHDAVARSERRDLNGTGSYLRI